MRRVLTAAGAEEVGKFVNLFWFSHQHVRMGVSPKLWLSWWHVLFSLQLKIKLLFEICLPLCGGNI